MAAQPEYHREDILLLNRTADAVRNGLIAVSVNCRPLFAPRDSAPVRNRLHGAIWRLSRYVHEYHHAGQVTGPAVVQARMMRLELAAALERYAAALNHTNGDLTAAIALGHELIQLANRPIPTYPPELNQSQYRLTLE